MLRCGYIWQMLKPKSSKTLRTQVSQFQLYLRLSLSPPVQFYFKNTSKLYFLTRNLDNNILFNQCYSVIAQGKNLKYLFTAKESQYIPDFQFTWNGPALTSVTSLVYPESTMYRWISNNYQLVIMRAKTG